MTLPPQRTSSSDTGDKFHRLQPISKWLLKLFVTYLDYYIPRHFHGLRVLHRERVLDLRGLPVLIYLNHPSWWDPLFALYLSQHLFPERFHYGPIATEGLNKFQFLGKLGFFGINPKTRAGAAKFLQLGRQVLSRSNGTFWVTAQGHFSDVRIRPVALQSGVAHLARAASEFLIVPLAFEYAFWNERHPEAFVCFGNPISVRQGTDKSVEEWLRTLAVALESAQDDLSSKVIQRDARAFQSLFQSHSGTGGVYDLWRALKMLFLSRSTRAKLRAPLS